MLSAWHHGESQDAPAVRLGRPQVIGQSLPWGGGMWHALMQQGESAR